MLYTSAALTGVVRLELVELVVWAFTSGVVVWL